MLFLIISCYVYLRIPFHIKSFYYNDMFSEAKLILHSSILLKNNCTFSLYVDDMTFSSGVSIPEILKKKHHLN